MLDQRSDMDADFFSRDKLHIQRSNLKEWWLYRLVQVANTEGTEHME
jgi:hypothetical protein